MSDEKAKLGQIENLLQRNSLELGNQNERLINIERRLANFSLPATPNPASATRRPGEGIGMRESDDHIIPMGTAEVVI